MQKYIYIGIGLIIVILIALYIGRSIGKKDQEDAQTTEKIKYVQVDNKKAEAKIDSLIEIVGNIRTETQIIKEKEIIIREKAKDIVIEKPEGTELCDELYDNATQKISLLEETIIIKDTVERNLNSVIYNQSLIMDTKDRIISNKDEEIRLVKSLNNTRKKKYTIGLQIGYGATVVTQGNTATFKTSPYIGVGVSRTIFSF